MDNLTHSLLAIALAKTPLGRRSPLAGAALVIGANLPDLDGLVALVGGKPSYLLHHRGITHSVVGILAQAPLLWLVMTWIERWWVLDARGFRGASRGGLFTACLTGLASHFALDSLNSYGIRPWLPFNDVDYYGDLCFIVDPWLWLLFGAAGAVAGGRSRAGNWGWLTLAAGASAVVYMAKQSPEFLRWTWPFGLLTIAFARAARVPSWIVFVATAALLTGYLTLLHEAGSRALRQSLEDVKPHLHGQERIERVSRTPVPATPWRWNIILDTEKHVYSRWISVAGDAPTIQYRIAKNLDLPEVRAASLTPFGFVWTRFARHPFAAIAVKDGRRVVYLMDARYQTDPGPGWSTLEVPIEKE